jgi:hypothetical protein
MNSVGDEAIRRELLARLQTVGAGMSGGRRYVGGGVSDYGGKGPSVKSKAAAAKNPYLAYKSVYRSGLFDGTYDDYLAFQGLARAAPKVASGKPKGRPKGRPNKPIVRPAIFKWDKCKRKELNDPQTGKCVSKYSKLGMQINDKNKIYNKATNRYVLYYGKVGKKILAGGSVYE